jgi:nitrate/nitrite-specific signal transduction histidine kinase
MNERAEKINGEIMIESEGDGTLVQLSFDVPVINNKVNILKKPD